MRRLALPLAVLAAALAAAVPSASAAPLDAAVAHELAKARGATGGFVLDTTTGRTLAAVRPNRALIPASVEKLFTGSTALLRFGADGTLDTAVLGRGRLDDAGRWRGDLYLRGAGDPTFGSTAFTTRAYGAGATATELAAALRDAGIRRVTGGVYGDESVFDKRRGGPASGYALDVWIGGPLSGLLYNRGLARENGSALQKRPARFAAQQLAAELARQGVRVNARRVGERAAPPDAQELARVSSPSIATLVRLMLVPSDNLLAEMLLKAVGANFGTAGSTTAGAAVVRSTLAPFGVRPTIADGSGLSRSDRTTPRHVVTLLKRMRDVEGFRDGLAVAGRTGTLASRMRRTAAQDRCSGKTGTLSNVSALAGFCTTANGHVVAFAFLFNSVYPSTAKAVEDRLAIRIARSRPAGRAAAGTTTKQPQPTAAPNRAPGGASAASATRPAATVRAAR